MPTGDSTIRVNIIGDAKSLTKATDTAESSVKGMNKKLVAAGGIIAGAFAVDAVLDFGQTALAEADRVADAAGRIEKQLGPELAKTLRDRADDFSAIGASEGDMLDLEARFIDIGTAAGIADENLGPLAEDASEVASAMALATDVDAATWLDLIAKAGGGAKKPLKDLGIDLDEAAVAARALRDSGKDLPDQLTEGELAAARQAIIIETLTERYGDVTTAGGDLEANQAAIQAKLETLMGRIGDALDGPLNDFLTWLLNSAATDLAEDIGQIQDAIEDLLTPLARAVDLLRAFASLAPNIGKGDPNLDPTRRNRTPFKSGSGSNVNININGGSPEVIEQSVKRAVDSFTRRNQGL